MLCVGINYMCLKIQGHIFGELFETVIELIHTCISNHLSKNKRHS